ncbi:unannotated protein [freshwater metagenome]|uniref:Unannotated protein n=1 Tax=freshwater metagenome TaxID=449393 RepID=A0A6J6Q911_9ZZZZ
MANQLPASSCVNPAATPSDISPNNFAHLLASELILSTILAAGVFACAKYEKIIATAAPISVEDNLEKAVLSLSPGPITISAVTGTFTEATSPRCRALATTEQSRTVIETDMTPKLKIETHARATPAPIAVPTIWPNPSRTDL